VNYLKLKSVKPIFFFLLFFLFITSDQILVAKTRYKSSGEIDFFAKTFKDDKNPETDDQKIGLSTNLSAAFKKGKLRGKATINGKVEEAKTGESFLFIEDSYLLYKKRPWLLKVGFQVFNWSTTEVFHPSDIINSKFIGGEDTDKKKGEFTFLIQRRIGKGRLNLVVMPRFEDPRFASKLFFSGNEYSIKEALWWEESGRVSFDNYGLQGGLFLTQSLGPMDITLYAIKNRDRSNGIFYFKVEDPIKDLHPVYFQVQHYGGTLQLILGAWNIKLEYDKRIFDGDFLDSYELNGSTYSKLAGFVDFGQKELKKYDWVAMGIEKTFYWNSGAETTLILEGQTILNASKEERANLDVFQKDILFGIRHNLNDVMGSEFLLSAIKDLEREKEHLMSFEYKRRLSSNWKAGIGLKAIEAPQKGLIPKGLEFSHEKNELNLKLTRFF
tara:strand:- start:4245 stop:5567 length:1323 start_codon:yes stop_codon:yes gene_type:complete